MCINDSDGNRTRVTAVKGRCLNRLTMEPCLYAFPAVIPFCRRIVGQVHLSDNPTATFYHRCSHLASGIFTFLRFCVFCVFCVLSFCVLWNFFEIQRLFAEFLFPWERFGTPTDYPFLPYPRSAISPPRQIRSSRRACSTVSLRFFRALSFSMASSSVTASLRIGK